MLDSGGREWFNWIFIGLDIKLSWLLSWYISGDQSSPFIPFFSHRALGKVKFKTAWSGSVPRLWLSVAFNINWVEKSFGLSSNTIFWTNLSSEVTVGRAGWKWTICRTGNQSRVWIWLIGFKFITTRSCLSQPGLLSLLSHLSNDFISKPQTVTEPTGQFAGGDHYWDSTRLTSVPPGPRPWWSCARLLSPGKFRFLWTISGVFGCLELLDCRGQQRGVSWRHLCNCDVEQWQLCKYCWEPLIILVSHCYNCRCRNNRKFPLISLYLLYPLCVWSWGWLDPTHLNCCNTGRKDTIKNKLWKTISHRPPLPPPRPRLGPADQEPGSWT